MNEREWIAELEKILETIYQKKIRIETVLSNSLFGAPYYFTAIELVYFVYLLENDYSIAFDKKFFLDRSNLSMQGLLTYLVQATNKNSIN